MSRCAFGVAHKGVTLLPLHPGLANLLLARQLLSHSASALLRGNHFPMATGSISAALSRRGKNLDHFRWMGSSVAVYDARPPKRKRSEGAKAPGPSRPKLRGCRGSGSRRKRAEKRCSDPPPYDNSLWVGYDRRARLTLRFERTIKRFAGNCAQLTARMKKAEAALRARAEPRHGLMPVSHAELRLMTGYSLIVRLKAARRKCGDTAARMIASRSSCSIPAAEVLFQSYVDDALGRDRYDELYGASREELIDDLVAEANSALMDPFGLRAQSVTQQAAVTRHQRATASRGRANRASRRGAQRGGSRAGNRSRGPSHRR